MSERGCMQWIVEPTKLFYVLGGLVALVLLTAAAAIAHQSAVGRLGNVETKLCENETFHKEVSSDLKAINRLITRIAVKMGVEPVQ